MKNKISFIFDTETNGLHNCSVLSISFIILQYDRVIKEETRYYFAKESCDKKAIKVNGLTKEVIKSKRNGCGYSLYFEDDYDWLVKTMKKYRVNNIVAHNTNFDIKFLPREIKDKIDNNTYSTFCTMINNSKFVGIKKGNGYKYPSLSEACKAYGIKFDDNQAHSSDYDTLKACELFVATI